MVGIIFKNIFFKFLENYTPLPRGGYTYRATVGKYIYTFGGYDGSKRLDIIEKYSISKNKWEE